MPGAADGAGGGAAADGAGGGAATIGYDARTRLTPLTVAFHEAQFIGVAGGENRELLQFGPPALWDGKVRQEHNIPLGPANPQALNRYAYCLGNPLRYVDPTGHDWIEIGEKEYTLEQLRQLQIDLANLASFFEYGGFALVTIGGLLTLSTAAAPAGIGLVIGGAVWAVEGMQVEDVAEYLDDVIAEAEQRGLSDKDIITLKVSRVQGEGLWYNSALVLTSSLTPNYGNYMWGLTALCIRGEIAGSVWRSQ